MGVISRQPPAVWYPLRRSRTLGWLLVAVLLAGAGCLGGWLVLGLGPTPFGWVFAAGCCWVLAATCAFQFWLSQLSGALRWDGQFWAIEAKGAATAPIPLVGPVHVLLDLPSHLWLQVQPTGRGRTWLWLERSAHPEHWFDLRRAVYSPAKPGADNADETALASSRGRES